MSKSPGRQTHAHLPGTADIFYCTTTNTWHCQPATSEHSQQVSLRQAAAISSLLAQHGAHLTPRYGHQFSPALRRVTAADRDDARAFLALRSINLTGKVA